jgi:hypothetical protein
MFEFKIWSWIYKFLELDQVSTKFRNFSNLIKFLQNLELNLELDLNKLKDNWKRLLLQWAQSTRHSAQLGKIGPSPLRTFGPEPKTVESPLPFPVRWLTGDSGRPAVSCQRRCCPWPCQSQGEHVRGLDGWKPHQRRRSMVAQGRGRGTPVGSADTRSLALKIKP